LSFRRRTRRRNLVHQRCSGRALQQKRHRFRDAFKTIALSQTL